MTMEPVERARRICLGLPEAAEQEAWGAPTFRVRKKIFAMVSSGADAGEARRPALWCKAAVGVQSHLVEEAPESYFVPPYVGVKGWVGIHLDAVDDETLRSHVVESYCLIAPRKLAAAVE
jgi:hypothetical protein